MDKDESEDNSTESDSHGIATLSGLKEYKRLPTRVSIQFVRDNKNTQKKTNKSFGQKRERKPEDILHIYSPIFRNFFMILES